MGAGKVFSKTIENEWGDTLGDKMFRGMGKGNWLTVV